MSETLFFAPAKSAQFLINAGIPEPEAFAHLVRLKETEFCHRYAGTSYFDPRELRRIIAKKG